MKKTVEKTKKINFTERGITLIALVITIIILLILAGVTLNTALRENGLYKMAKKAVNEYQKSEKQEQEAMEKIEKELEKILMDYNDYVGAYVTGYTPKTGECTIESTTSGSITKTFTTEEMKWRIWDYDKTTKTIRLISSKPTDTRLPLRYIQGYNNGVWAINEICRKCYGSDKNRNNSSKLKKNGYTKGKHI